MYKIKRKSDDVIFEVWKYIKVNEFEQNVWCFDWQGRHVIGQDCDWLNPTFESFKNNDKAILISDHPYKIWF